MALSAYLYHILFAFYRYIYHVAAPPSGIAASLVCALALLTCACSLPFAGSPAGIPVTCTVGICTLDCCASICICARDRSRIAALCRQHCRYLQQGIEALKQCSVLLNGFAHIIYAIKIHHCKACKRLISLLRIEKAQAVKLQSKLIICHLRIRRAPLRHNAYIKLRDAAADIIAAERLRLRL